MQTPTYPFKMSCPSNTPEFSEVIESAAPSLIPFALALLLASTNDASYAKRLAGLSVLCAISVGMSLFGGCGIVEIGKAAHQQGAADQKCDAGIFATQHAQSTAVSFKDDAWYSEIYDFAPLGDLAIVAMGGYSMFMADGLPGAVWFVACIGVFLAHGVGLVVNSVGIDAAICAAALLATGILNGVGRAIGDVLDFVPPRLRVSEASTHALVGLVFIVVMPFANKDQYATKLEFDDVLKNPSLVFTVVSLVALLASSFEASDPVKQITSLGGTFSLVLANYHATMDALKAEDAGGIVVGALNTGCEMIPESVLNVLGPNFNAGVDLLAAVGIMAAPVFLALALVLAVTETHPHFGGPAKEGLKLKDMGSTAEKNYGVTDEESKSHHCTSVSVVEGAMCSDPERAPAGAITLCQSGSAVSGGSRAGAMP